MTESDVLAVLDRLDTAGVAAWLDGGWGVDALVGRQTREHADLDLVVSERDLARAAAALGGLGFAPDETAEPGLPARLALLAPDGRRVDLHPVVFDERGNGWQPLGGDAWGAYPGADLRSTGQVAGRTVRCLSPDLQLRHHLGYPPDENDRRDLRILAAAFDVALPPGF